MKTIAKFQNPEEARIALTFLQAQDIHAFLPDSETFGNLPYLAFGLSGFRLMVPDDEVEKALELLANLPQVSEGTDQEEDKSDVS